MAYTSISSDRYDDLRYRNGKQNNREASIIGAASAHSDRKNSNVPRLTPSIMSLTTDRTALTRRFTTDAARTPTLNSLAAQRVPPSDVQEYGPSTHHKVQLLERKRQEYERLREQKRRFEAEMQVLDLQQQKERDELQQMEKDLTRGQGKFMAGHQSEPATPPEYHDVNSGFPTLLSKPNRYSTSSLMMSTQGLFNRPTRSGSQLTSPSKGANVLRQALIDDKFIKSVPGSRRESDEDEKEEAVRQDPTSHRSTNATNRYSMPVTKSRTAFNDIIDQTNTTGFLFGNELVFEPSEPNGYLQMTTEDDFPVLKRARENSVASNAPELASPVDRSNGWTTGHRAAKSSFSAMNMPEFVDHNDHNNHNGNQQSQKISPAVTLRSPVSVPTYGRSGESNQYLEPQSAFSSAKYVAGGPPRLQSSYSTNDVPTMKTASVSSSAVSNGGNSHAQQHLHNHNTSLGRVPPNMLNGRLSRDMSYDNQYESHGGSNGGNSHYPPITSTLHANAPDFTVIHNESQAQMVSAAHGIYAQAAPMAQGMYAQTIPSAQSIYSQPPPQILNPYVHQGMMAATVPQYNTHQPAAYYGNYGMNMLQSSMQGMHLTQPGVYSPHSPYAYPSQYLPNNNQGGSTYGGYGPYEVRGGSGGQGSHQTYGGQGRQAGVRDSQAKVIQSRRQSDGHATDKYANRPLDSFRGEIYKICKDQHGCRYLQKKLEERIPEQIHTIWIETNSHVVELMTDPFGNYLCQKLLEYSTDDDRTVLIENASSDMVRIALNQHGTRALQKMIEFVSTPRQVEIIIEALRFHVVELIQDLNGNHVIQKCLTRLSDQDARFIIDAVGLACLDVGSHRHGCCVLQRCIDHATGDQKRWLVRQIQNEALNLVQDPFGNYVIQYVLDLNEPYYTEALVAEFRGHVAMLSKQKFSSNVIEKCLRVAGEGSKEMIISELLEVEQIPKLLRDSYANYVIQTALDYAVQTAMKDRLVEAITPFMEEIKSTPHGRRIQAKLDPEPVEPPAGYPDARRVRSLLVPGKMMWNLGRHVSKREPDRDWPTMDEAARGITRTDRPVPRSPHHNDPGDNFF